MNEILELRRERDEMVKQLRAIADKCTAEKRDLNEEEKTLCDDLKAKIEVNKNREAFLITVNGLEEEMRGLGTLPQKLEPGDDPQKEDRQFETFGEQLRAVVVAETSQGKEIDERLIYRQMGMSEGVPGDGGYLVQKDFVAGLLKNAYETGILANRCRKYPIGTNSNGIKLNVVDEGSRATGSRMGGIQTYWTAEGTALQDSKPKFRQLEMSLQKLTGLLYATDELLSDTTLLEALVSDSFSEEFGFELDDAIIRGTGAGQPLGILNSKALVVQAAEAAQAVNTVIFENISNMWSRLPARLRRNAVWLINQEVEPQLDRMSIVAGAAALEPRFINYGPDGVLRMKGAPVVAIEQAERLGAAGDIILCNLNQYLLIDKGPMQAATSIHVRFVWDEQTFRFIYRVNGQPIWNRPLTPYKGANTLSPFVTLAART